MIIKIACPVCDRPGVMEDICPNCETDLTLIRGLMDLPVVPSPQSSVITKSSSILPWLILTAIAFLTLGIVLGGVGAYWPAQNNISQLQSETSQLEEKISQLQGKISQNKTPQPCNRGFEYVVRWGDSLSLIAMRFYGDAEQQILIVKENPSLAGKEDFLEVGDKLLIPDLNSECL
jgi:hypothetical protein